MKQLFLIVGLSIILFGCRKERTVNDTMPVAQHYVLEYSVNNDETTFRANFHHESSGTILPSGYSVTVNDSDMVMLTNPSAPGGTTYYYQRVDSGYLGAYFKMRRADGSVLHNVIPVNAVPIITFDSTYTTISISDTLRVMFSSDSLHSGESISVTISQDAVHYTFQNVPVQSGDTAVVLTPQHMTNLIAGSATMTITRYSAVFPLLETGNGSGEMRASVVATQEVVIQQ